VYTKIGVLPRSLEAPTRDPSSSS